MLHRLKTVHKRASARQVSYEPWNLDPRFPVHTVDYTHRPRNPGAFHMHDVLEIGLCHSGDGIFMVEDKSYSFLAGDIFVISSMEAHFAYASAGARSEWTYVFLDPMKLVGPSASPELLDLSRCCGERFDNRFRDDASPRACAAIRDLVQELRSCGAHFRDAVRGHVVTLLVELKRRQSTAAHVGSHRSRRPELMQSLAPALNLIAREYDQPLPIARLSGSCRMSPSHFRRVFGSQLGASPRDYLLGYRVAMAACLLSGTDLPITRIALDAGFQTLSSFNRQFRTRKRCSPRQWRKRSKTPGDQ